MAGPENPLSPRRSEIKRKHAKKTFPSARMEAEKLFFSLSPALSKAFHAGAEADVDYCVIFMIFHK
jgi:hypothetical protein